MISRRVDEGVEHSEGFTVRRNGRIEHLTYEQLFIVGHRLWLETKYSTAAAIFDILATVKDRGPRAAIFLAHSHAMSGDFGRCSATLNRALPRELYQDAASRLHDIFVFWKVGLLVDVRNDLLRLADEFPELPSLALLLGDLFYMNGAIGKSRRFWFQAVEKDSGHGAVAEAAMVMLKNCENN